MIKKLITEEESFGTTWEIDDEEVLVIGGELLSSYLLDQLQESEEKIFSYIQMEETFKLDEELGLTLDNYYHTLLNRLVKGAEYISSEEFNRLPAEKQKEAKDLYDRLEREILEYQGYSFE